MIRYQTDGAKLLADIAEIDAKWLSKAQKRTSKFVKAGAYSEKSSLWSTTKPVFMKAQWFKCVFCERQFENEQYGKIEFDVEHFRPKSSVLTWPSATLHPNLSYGFKTGETSLTGYYWLAYDVENYAASCKACNSVLKSNYFPIEGTRGKVAASVSELTTEQPFLCYPLGEIDDDPEDLITFVATVAMPKAAAGHMRDRGQIIIDFFDLNGREMLHRQRAQMISIFGSALSARHGGTATAEDQQLIEQMGHPALPHAGCVRAFKHAFDVDPPLGRRIFARCRAYVFDQTASAPPEL